MIKLQQFVKIMGLLVAIDSVYIYFMRNYFNTQIRIIQGSFILFNQKLLIGAVITYVLLAFALHYFVLSNRQKSKSYSFERNAFLLGIIIYGVFDMTNYALFKNWSFQTACIDMLWGGTLCAICTFVYKFLFF